MLAGEVTTGCGNGIGKTARKKMKEWFFFNGVYTLGDQLSVNQTVQNPISIFSDSAPTTTLIGYGTKMAAEQTMNTPILPFFIQQSFMHINGIS